jgi:hypothetical protein
VAGKRGEAPTRDGGRLFDVEDGGHALPFSEALFEPQHFILEYSNFLGNMNELSVAIASCEMYAEQRKRDPGTF